jgi:hypothetical protein
VFFVLTLKIAAQKKKTTSSNNPVYIISDDGSSRVMVDGLTAIFKSKPAGVDKVIKYGPWRMQNKPRVILQFSSLDGCVCFFNSVPDDIFRFLH